MLNNLIMTFCFLNNDGAERLCNICIFLSNLMWPVLSFIRLFSRKMEKQLLPDWDIISDSLSLHPHDYQYEDEWPGEDSIMISQTSLLAVSIIGVFIAKGWLFKWTATGNCAWNNGLFIKDTSFNQATLQSKHSLN